MGETTGRTWTHGNRIVGIDLGRRRLWVGGQRVHHGATSIALAATVVAQAVTGRSTPPRSLACLLAGGAMVAHDWQDRRVWFERGAQG
jgi:hypothetical protein